MALHLKFALNLDTIADEMIEKVSEYWKSPFDAPTLVFPEYKLEQWFRFKWMERRGVLANLNKKSIDRFLFEILGTAVHALDTRDREGFSKTGASWVKCGKN